MIKKTHLMLRVEAALDEELTEFFRFEYIERGLTLRQLSAKLEKLTGIKILPGVLSKWFARLGIPARKLEWRFNNDIQANG